MLAVVILSIGLLGLIGATARALSVVSVSRHYAITRELFERTRVEWPLRTREGRLEGETSGAFDAPVEARWERVIEPVFEGLDEPLYRVRTRIFATDRGREVTEEFTEIRYVPGG